MKQFRFQPLLSPTLEEEEEPFDNVELLGAFPSQMLSSPRALSFDSIDCNPPMAAEASVSSFSTAESESEQSIKVAIRVRPLNNQERCMLPSQQSARNPALFRLCTSAGTEDPSAWSVTNTTIAQKYARKVQGKSLFSFDSIFNADSQTSELYREMVAPIVGQVMAGRHGTVFCYGQTGSGKTFTMQGSEQGSDGIIQLAATDVFCLAEKSNRNYEVRVSYIEIYNEKVRDLLGHLRKRGSKIALPTLHVREDAKRGVHVGCLERKVKDAESLLALLNKGNTNRNCSATDMNERSSRSHAIFRITIESRPKEENTSLASGEGRDQTVRISNLNLVDLAGSENGKLSGVAGQTQKEGGMINQSLLSLSQVIHALSLPPNKRPSFINYRDSKLTRILQPHLSGNALMSILCCVSPSRLHVEETRSSLRFAARGKLVQMKPFVNEEIDDAALLKKLQKEVRDTRKALVEVVNREARTRDAYKESLDGLQELKTMVLGSGGAPQSGAKTNTSVINAGLEQSSKRIPSPSLSTPVASRNQLIRNELEGSDGKLPVQTEDALASGASTSVDSSNFKELASSRMQLFSEFQGNEASSPPAIVARNASPTSVADHTFYGELRDPNGLHDKLEETKEVVDCFVEDLQGARRCIRKEEKVCLLREVGKMESKLENSNQDGL